MFFPRIVAVVLATFSLSGTAFAAPLDATARSVAVRDTQARVKSLLDTLGSCTSSIRTEMEPMNTTNALTDTAADAAVERLTSCAKVAGEKYAKLGGDGVIMNDDNKARVVSVLIDMGHILDRVGSRLITTADVKRDQLDRTLQKLFIFFGLDVSAFLIGQETSVEALVNLGRVITLVGLDLTARVLGIWLPIPPIPWV